MSIEEPRTAGLRVPFAGRHGLRVALALGALLWALAGLVGVFRYVDGYARFRGFPPPRAPQGVANGKVVTASFYSPALHARRAAEVYLPPGYARAAATGRRFPVLYLLHGSPGSASQLFQIGRAAVDADTLLAARRIAPMIIVVPDGRSAHSGAHTEWANAAAGRFESYLLDVVRFADRSFATVPDRGHRVLAGLSEGGYGAVNVALHHLGVFGGLQSWSGYFTETPTGPFAGASRASLDANSPALYVPRLAPRIRRLGLRAYLYQGLAQRSGTADVAGFARELRAAGAQVDLSLYHGGHDWALWRRQMPHMLEVASGWFAAAGGAPR